MSSNKDISQQLFSDLFSPFERDFSENHSGFHRYVAQKPLFGKSFKNVTKPVMPQSFSSGENDDTESAYQVKVGSDKNLANMVSGLIEKVDGSCSTLASLTTEIELVRGLIENQVKRNDEIVSEHKNEEGIAELLEKFEVFIQSYKEHARVTSENMENMKCDLKAIQDYILKAGESINENQETMEALLLEAVGSMKTILKRGAEQQVKNVYCQLLHDVEDRFSEEMEDLKKLVQLSLQSVKTVHPCSHCDHPHPQHDGERSEVPHGNGYSDSHFPHGHAHGHQHHHHHPQHEEEGTEVPHGNCYSDTRFPDEHQECCPHHHHHHDHFHPDGPECEGDEHHGHCHNPGYGSLPQCFCYRIVPSKRKPAKKGEKQDRVITNYTYAVTALTVEVPQDYEAQDGCNSDGSGNEGPRVIEVTEPDEKSTPVEEADPKLSEQANCSKA